MDTRLIRSDSLLCPRGKNRPYVYPKLTPINTDTDFLWPPYFGVRINGFLISDMIRKIILELSDEILSGQKSYFPVSSIR